MTTLNIIRYSLRELFNHRKFSFLLVIYFAIGMTPPSLIESLRLEFETALKGQSGNLLGADLAVHFNRPFTEQQKNIIHSAIIGNYKVAKLKYLTSMAYSQGHSRLVEVKAIEESYPFYGDILIKNNTGEVYPHKSRRLNPSEVWVYPELLTQLNAKTGDELEIGEQKFKIVGQVVDDPQQTARFGGLAPKVFMRLEDLKKTKLIARGSTAIHALYYKLTKENDLNKLLKGLKERFDDPRVKVIIPATTTRRIQRMVHYLGDFMGLVALVALILTNLAIVYLLAGHLQKRNKDYAILRTLGFSWRQLAVYLAVQLGTIAAFSVVISYGMSFLIKAIIAAPLGEALGVELSPYLGPYNALILFFIGPVTGTLACLPLLYRYIKTPPGLVFKDTLEKSKPIQNLLLSLPFLIYFTGLAIYIARSIPIGLSFALANVGFALITGMAILFFAPMSERYFKYFSLPTRLSLKSLVRRPLGTITIMVSLTLGVTLLVLLSHIEQGLQQEMLSPDGKAAPSLFLIDIQEDQVPILEEIASRYNASLVGTSPMIKSKIVSINDEKFSVKVRENFTREEQKKQRIRNHSVNLTYRTKLGPAEQLLEGGFTGQTDDQVGLTPISLEKRYAERIEAKIGDRIEFDIFGIQIKTKVTSIRKIKWTSFLPNFFIVFPPGVLEDAPKTYLSTISSTNRENKEKIMSDMFKSAPNVSAIDISRSIEKIMVLIDYLSITLQLMATFCLVIGVVVLITITHNQIQRREMELNFLKIIGLNGREMASMIQIEILTMTIISGILGIGLGVLACWPILHYFFDASFVFHPVPALVLISILITVSLIMAKLGARKIQESKPQQLLEEFTSSY